MRLKIIAAASLIMLALNSTAQHADPCTKPMADGMFQSLKANIAANDDDDTRLETAKELVERNCFSSIQVVKLCKLFLSDAARLKVAEWAYLRTVDPGNFTRVYTVFESDGYKKDLNTFINKTSEAH